MSLAVGPAVSPALALMERELRGGEPLAAEYPLVFEAGYSGRVVALSDGDRVVSACAALPRDLTTPQGPLRVGLIGSVATAREARGRGFATAVLDAAYAHLRSQGCAVALLWADDPRFYLPRGFRAAGCELVHALSPELLGALPPAPAGVVVREAEAADGPALHALYASQPARVDRVVAESERLAAIPGLRTLVALRDGAPVAYARRDRGADLRDCVHEWAGATDALLALFAAHGAAVARAGRTAHLLAPDLPLPATRALEAAGSEPFRGVLGLAKVIDPDRARAAAAAALERRGADPTRIDAIEDAALLDVLLPPRGRSATLARLARRHALPADALPMRAYLWGLDSI